MGDKDYSPSADTDNETEPQLDSEVPNVDNIDTALQSLTLNQSGLNAKTLSTTLQSITSTTTLGNTIISGIQIDKRNIEDLKLTPLQQGAIPKASKISEDSLSPEAWVLLHEISGREPPKDSAKWKIYSKREIDNENAMRRRTPGAFLPKLKSPSTARAIRSTDDPQVLLAPSVTVYPAPVPKSTSFSEFLEEHNITSITATENGRPQYLLDDDQLKQLIIGRAQTLVARMDAKKIDRGTQTYVSQSGKQHTVGCLNCGAEHHYTKCQLPLRPGFCHVCGAKGYDAEDCPYPHGVEHEYALGRCWGCSKEQSLYDPNCPDCNIRWEGMVDWMRLNYATWPAWLIPPEHRVMVGEESKEIESMLKRKIKYKFNNPHDAPNKLRRFLIRENALVGAPTLANPKLPKPIDLSEEKRRLAVQALQAPVALHHLDEIMKERPELKDGEGYTVLIPAKYKKTSTKKPTND
ncbi:uncharacterized protein LOC135165093 [Diachasmimorpha longicaudata]|uniref:uncharacterized protein LOC135165093 n=1 Tax=Diachasmimorpha longicaudata TaxID=58733 RepID=UPI0030B8947A